ncbi:hypothetical protein I79_024484 [Cricetulus griseus]|uniref:Uncharacterized protein n=1 Tax=Cricetulus griseus TaxID=10029 RepID=G3IKT1_CRIGR|nr:hypothetical protein I79_024484 [Cricetulus griseus]
MLEYLDNSTKVQDSPLPVLNLLIAGWCGFGSQKARLLRIFLKMVLVWCDYTWP